MYSGLDVTFDALGTSSTGGSPSHWLEEGKSSRDGRLLTGPVGKSQPSGSLKKLLPNFMQDHVMSIRTLTLTNACTPSLFAISHVVS